MEDIVASTSKKNPTLLVLLHQMIFYTTEGLAYAMNTERTQIHTHQHLNPHSTGGNLTLWNPITLETKLIPPFTLQTGTTRVMTDLTHNLMVPVVLEALEALMGLGVQTDPATTLPMSKTSCGNS